MKRIGGGIFSRVSTIGVVLLIGAVLGLSPPASGAAVVDILARSDPAGPDVPLTLFRSFDTPDTYGIARAARGTHLTGGRGVAVLQIPGEPVAAYLYIAGHDYPGLKPRYPGGDENVEVRVTRDLGKPTEATTTFTTVPIAHHGGTSFLSRLDITEAVRAGQNRVAVSRYNLNGPEGFVVIAVYRSVEADAALKTVQILDGADEGFYPLPPPQGPDSEVAAFTFTPVPCADRRARILLGIGGTEYGRGDEVFLFTGAGALADVLPDSDGDDLPDIIDRTHRLRRWDTRPLGNDPADRFGHREAVPGAVSLEEDRLGIKRSCGGLCFGAEMDLLEKEYTIPADAGFAAFQVQSENPEFGDSFTVYFAVNTVPYVDCPNPVPDIRVTKDVEPTTMPEPGGEVLFTVTVDNPPLPGVPQEDVNLTSLTDSVFGDITSVHGLIRETACTVPRFLPIGGSYQCTFRAHVSGTAAAPHRDTVRADGEGAETGAPVWDEDDAVVTFFTVPVGAIGDFVWEDADRDGVQDAGEPGIAGVPVELRDGVSGAFLGATVTDARGIYGFTDLAAGAHRVSVAPPPCMVRTWDLDGIGTPDTAAVALGAGEIRLDVDFGYARLRPGIDILKTVAPPEAYPGDVVTYSFQVTNTGEAALFNVTVTDSTLNPTPPHVVATIADLAPGAAVTLQIGGFRVPTCSDSRTRSGPCTDGSTGCALLPGIADPGGVFPSCIPPAMCHLTNTATVTAFHCAGPPVTDADDACLTILPLKRIGDLVWLDADGNAIRDAGEPGISGVAVTLRRPNGSTVTTRTDSSGGYSFWELRDGVYTVTPAAPAAAPLLTTPPSPRTVTLDKCQIDGLTADFGFRAAPAP